MHGHHERSGQGCKKPVGAQIVMPLPVRALPAEREKGVEFTAQPCGAVADRPQVGDQTDIPEQKTHGEIGGDCKRVPDQG